MRSSHWLLIILLIGIPANRSWADQGASLSYQGKTLQEWIDDLATEEPYQREKAIEALQALGEPAVPGLIGALQDKNVRVRRGATVVLGKIGALTPDVVPALQQAMRDGDQKVRENATEALARVGIRPERPPEEKQPKSEQLRKLWLLAEEKQLSNLPRFGEQLFVQAGPEAGMPPSNILVPPGYLLGPGDELSIRCWSEGVEHLNTTVPVSAEGSIYVPLLGEIRVAGETLAAIRSLLTQQLHEFYTDSQISATVTTTRVVTVYVTGDVKRPGRYDLNGTATVLTVLYAAGGPTTSGSLRNIRWVSRGEEPVEIDLYPYLLYGEPLSDQPLRPGDTIFVGSVGPEIGITGQVQRPARYELTKPITCAEAIELAAGLSGSAYARAVQVWRVANHQQQTVINVNLQVPSSTGRTPGSDFMLQAGDVVVIPSVLPIPENAARITGAVRRPGIYEVEDGMYLSDLIQKAQGVDEGAYLQQAEIRRLDANKQYRYSSFSVGDVLEGNPEEDIAVKSYDEVRIYYREEVTLFTYVEVRGPVQNPGQYRWLDQIRVRDLITQAGGVTEEAYLLLAHLLRLQPDGNRQIIKVSLAAALRGDPEANIALAAGDIIEISTQQEAVGVRLVHIDGFVQRPDSYEYYAGMKISDLIFASGGLCPGAGHTIEYTHGRQSGKPEVQQLTLAWTREDQAIVEPDLTLKPDDQVTVVGVGDFRQQAEVVTVRGQVAHPGARILRSSTEERETVYDLLQRVGPLLSDANPDGIIVYRPTEKALATGQRQNLQQIMGMYNRQTAETIVSEEKEWQQTVIGEQSTTQAAEIFAEDGATTIAIRPRHLSLSNWITGIPIEGQKLIDTQGQKGDTPLQDGDIVTVPRLKSTVAVLGAVVRPGTVLYQSQSNIRDYINKVGGLADDAAMERAVVIRANSTARLASDIEQVKPGDIILVPSDYLLRTIHTRSGFERILRALGPVIGALLLAG